MRFFTVCLLIEMIAANKIRQGATEATTTEIVTNTTTEIIENDSSQNLELLKYFLAVFILAVILILLFSIYFFPKYKTHAGRKGSIHTNVDDTLSVISMPIENA